jgi:hypothetical protein
MSIAVLTDPNYENKPNLNIYSQTINSQNGGTIGGSLVLNNLTVNGSSNVGGGTSGVWVPQLLFNGSSTGITYSTPPTATYNQIGNMVFINGSMQLSNIGGFAGDAIPTVAGIPIPVGAAVLPSVISCTWNACPLDTNATIVTMHSVPNSSLFTLNQCHNTGGSEIALYFMFMTNNTVINFSGFYFSS